MEKNEVFSSEIIRTDSKHKNNLYDLLNIIPAKPLDVKDNKKYTCDFTPTTDKIYIPKRKSRAKVKTVRDIRTAFENDTYAYLTSDLESQQNYLLKKIRSGSAKNENTTKIAKKMIRSETPILRSTWQMLVNLNPDHNVHSRQYVLWNGKYIQINGSTGGNKKMICNYDLAKTKVALQMKKITTRNNIIKKNKGLLRNSLSIKFKPGPLRRKKFLDDSHQKYNGDIELVNLPKVGLVVQPTYGTFLDPTITQFLNNLHKEDGIISEKWAEFAVSVLGKTERSNTKLVDSGCVIFGLDYKCNQHRILVRKDKDHSYVTPNIETTSTKSTINDQLNILPEIKDMMRKILDAVEISLNQDNMFTTDEDFKQISKEDTNAVDITTVPKDKTKRKYLELDRLDVTVIRLPEDLNKESTQDCKNEHCSLGCICDSLNGKKNFRPHCGREECMFNCKCAFSKYTNIIADSNGSDSTYLIPGIINIEDEINLNLAKEEQKFHQTVIVTGEKNILFKSERRNWKSSKKYENFYRNMCLKNVNHKKKRVLSITALKLDCENIEPWCMVHNLYKCFCKGKFTERTTSHMPEKLAKDTMIKDSVVDVECSSENIQRSTIPEASHKPVLRQRRQDTVSLEKVAKPTSIYGKCYSNAGKADEKQKKTSLVTSSLAEDGISPPESSDPFDFYYSDYNGTCSRVNPYEGRKYSDGHYKNTNSKIKEMEKNDITLHKKMMNILQMDADKHQHLLKKVAKECDKNDNPDKNAEKLKTSKSEKNMERLNTSNLEKNVEKLNTSNSEKNMERLNTAHIEKNVEKLNTSNSEKNVEKLNTSNSEKNVEKLNTSNSEKNVEKLNTSNSEKNVEKLNTSNSEKNVKKLNTSNSEKNVEKLNTSNSEKNVEKLNTSNSEKNVEKLNTSNSEKNVEMLNTSNSEKNVEKLNTSNSEKNVEMLNTSNSEKNVEKLNTSNSEKNAKKLNTSHSVKNAKMLNTSGKEFENLIQMQDSDNAMSNIIEPEKKKHLSTEQSNNPNLTEFLYNFNDITSDSNKPNKRLLPTENKLVGWLESSYKLHKKRMDQGLIKTSLEPPTVGKVVLHAWDFILSRYKERKNHFLISKQKPYRIFMGVHTKTPFFESCININEIRFADLHKYPQTVKNLLANATDLKDNFCILRGLSHCWELVGSVTKVNKNDETTGEMNNEFCDLESNSLFHPSALTEEQLSVGGSKEMENETLKDSEISLKCSDEAESSKWFIMTLENDFSEIRFYKKGFFVKYESIIKAISVARMSAKTVRLSSQKCADKSNGPQFGIYAIPYTSEYCVFIGPYELEDSLGIETIKSILDVRKLYRTRGFWMYTNKVDNLKVIDNPMSFMPSSSSSFENCQAIPLENHLFDDKHSSDGNESESPNKIYIKERDKSDTQSLLKLQHKKVVKPIKIRKTNGFYHLATDGLLKKISLQSPALVNSSLTAGTDITKSVLLNVVPNNSLVSLENMTSPSKDKVEERLQLKISAVYSQKEANLNTKKNEGSMFVLKPEEINRRLFGEHNIKEDTTQTITKDISESTSMECPLFLNQDQDTFPKITGCTVDTDICVISDEEDETLSKDSEDSGQFRDVLIKCSNVKDLGWIWGRRKLDSFLLSIRIPGCGQYTEFCTEKEAFELLNRELSQIVGPSKPFNFDWKVVELTDDFEGNINPLNIEHLRQVITDEGQGSKVPQTLVGLLKSAVRTYSRKSISSPTNSSPSPVPESND